eukprot:172739-Pleurochrysis_carterae.AAC.1
MRPGMSCCLSSAHPPPRLRPKHPCGTRARAPKCPCFTHAVPMPEQETACVWYAIDFPKTQML